MANVSQVLLIVRGLLKLAPVAVDMFEEMVSVISGTGPDEQVRLTSELALELRKRRLAADKAIEFIRTGKRDGSD